MKLPWFAWFPGDFLNATRGWSLLQKGGYREALDTQWALGGLPADKEEFRRTISASAREWAHIWPKIEPKFPVCDDGLRRNPRLSREQAKGDELSAVRSKLGQLGAKKRWQGDGNSYSNCHPEGAAAGDGNSHDFANGKTMASTSTSTSTSTRAILEPGASQERARAASPGGSRARCDAGELDENDPEVQRRRRLAQETAERLAREKGGK